MAIVILVSPHVYCSIAMATMNFMLLVLQALKNKIMLMLMLLELCCPPGKPWGIGGLFLCNVRVKSFLLSAEHMEKDGASWKKNKNPK